MEFANTYSKSMYRIIMENHREKKEEEKILIEEENKDRDLGEEDTSAEEFIGEKSDWSEDISEYEKNKKSETIK